jgi:hypothetical protein
VSIALKREKGRKITPLVDGTGKKGMLKKSFQCKENGFFSLAEW